MSKIYIVQWHYDYEGFDIAGIFTTEDEAVTYAKEHLGGDETWVERYTVPFASQGDFIDKSDTIFHIRTNKTY